MKINIIYRRISFNTPGSLIQKLYSCMGYPNPLINNQFLLINIASTHSAHHVWGNLFNQTSDYHQRFLLLFCNLWKLNFCSFIYYCKFVFIEMLDESKICNRELRVYYGTTKFCPYFLKGMNCELPVCNYAHFYIPELTH